MTTIHLSDAVLMTTDQRARPRAELFAMAFLARYRVAKTRATYEVGVRQWFGSRSERVYDGWAGRCVNSPGPGPNLCGGPNVPDSTSLPPADAFWSLIDRSDPDACWLWPRAGNHHGYGQYRGWYAHRLAYTLAVGPIPDGLTLDHLCGVSACVNPAHLDPCTQAENHRRWVESLTHCPHGHEKSPENTYVTKAGFRLCRECRRINQRRYTARKRSAT